MHERFNLHASVHVPAHDDLARERLCRYLARPAFYPFGYREARSLARFGIRRDGLVVYRVKRAGRGRVTQRVMTPRECSRASQRWCRRRATRFFGCTGCSRRATHARARVVPRPPKSHARCTRSSPPNRANSKAEATAAAVVPPLERPRPPAPRGDGRGGVRPDHGGRPPRGRASRHGAESPNRRDVREACMDRPDGPRSAYGRAPCERSARGGRTGRLL